MYSSTVLVHLAAVGQHHNNQKLASQEQCIAKHGDNDQNQKIEVQDTTLETCKFQERVGSTSPK